VENGLTDISNWLSYARARTAELLVFIVMSACWVSMARAAEPTLPPADTQKLEEPKVAASSADELPTPESSGSTFVALGAASSASDEQLALLRQDMQALHQELRLLRAQLAEVKAPAQPEPASLSPLQRGNYYVGGTLALGYRSRDNYETLAGTVDDGRRFTTKIEGIAGYVLKTDALALGMTVAYRRTLNKGVISDSGADANDLNSVEYDVRVGPALRGFLPVDKPGRFFVYAQAAVVFGYGERVERTFTETTSSVLSSNGFSMGLAVQPGLMVVANENFAFEIGVNVLGLEYQNYKATTDHTSNGREQDVNLSVDLNLLSLQFAFVGYF